ncbi:hypothetical protein A8F94_01415 [Bacillus sp. FJAT-27225]|nr:hypothetical protein A8F94_01415 [Bacillus sp. FJAT-27225]
MGNNLYSQTEQDIINCINKIIKAKQQDPHNQSTAPHPLKKMDLESYLETVAAQQSIPFEKQSTPLETVYKVRHEGITVRCKFYYRYTTYYTRHQVTFS